jgi:hypothetical protein
MRSVSSLESQSRNVQLGGSSRSPAAPSITNANVLWLGAIYPRFDGRRVASCASTPSHHRPSRNAWLWNDRSRRKADLGQGYIFKGSQIRSPRNHDASSTGRPMSQSGKLREYSNPISGVVGPSNCRDRLANSMIPSAVRHRGRSIRLPKYSPHQSRYPSTPGCAPVRCV